MTATGLERIADAFAGEGRRAALMPYMMGGFPTLDRSRQIAEAYIDAGADLIELGIPFSDPLADGPVIHAAATATLACGVTTADVLELAAAFADRVPVVVMAYANTVLAPGLERFLERLLGAGVAGMIVPDLPHEEGEQLAREAASRGLALVPLVAPTTTDERLARIGARASGFVYVVAVTGTTGERATQAGSLAPLVARAKGASGVPAAVGFGISTPEHALAAAAAGADGVIVGSRLVRAAADGEEIGGLVAAFARALSAPVP